MPALRSYLLNTAEGISESTLKAYGKRSTWVVVTFLICKDLQTALVLLSIMSFETWTICVKLASRHMDNHTHHNVLPVTAATLHEMDDLCTIS